MFEVWNNLLWAVSTLISAIIGNFLGTRSTRVKSTGSLETMNIIRFDHERLIVYAALLRLATQAKASHEAQGTIPESLLLELEDVLGQIELLASPETKQHAANFGKSILASAVSIETNREFPTNKETEHFREQFVASARREFGMLAGTTSDAFLSEEKLTVERSAESPRRSSKARIPVPIALGGIGLLLASALPRGLQGWQGFLIGFSIGLFLLAFSTAQDVENRSAQNFVSR